MRTKAQFLSASIYSEFELKAQNQSKAGPILSRVVGSSMADRPGRSLCCAVGPSRTVVCVRDIGPIVDDGMVNLAQPDVGKETPAARTLMRTSPSAGSALGGVR